MTLSKRSIDIPINGGLNQIVNPKLMPAPSLLTLTNGRYLKEGGIDKQFGYTRLSNATSLSALTTWNDELLAFNTINDYTFVSTYSDVSNTWISKGRAQIARTELVKVSGSPQASSGVDTIAQDSVLVTTWLENSTYYYNVIDLTTGAQVISSTSFMTSASAVYPRLISISGYVFIFYNDSGDLKWKRISTASFAVTSGTLYSTMDTTGQFDVVAYGSYLYVGFKLSGASTVQISRVSFEMISLASTTMASTAPNASAQFVLSTDGFALYVISGQGGVIRIATYLLADLSPIAGPTNYTPIGGASVIVATAGVIYYSSTAIAPSNSITYTMTVGPALGAATNEVLLMRSVGIASKVSSDGYLTLLHESTLQSTYFVVKGREVVAKYCPGEGGTHAAVRRPSNFSTDNGLSYVGMLRKGRIQSENATIFAALQPHAGVLELASNYVTLPQEAGLLVAGGVLRNYDGVAINEYGFHLYPEGVTAAASNSTGTIANGTYLIYALYEWTDAKGVRHQSAPSVGYSLAVSGVNDTITVTVPGLRVTSLTDLFSSLQSRSSVLVKVFITEASGTVAYYAGSATNPSVMVSDTVDVILTADPSTLTSNEILYTTGGVLENISAPSHGYAFTHKNHVVICDLEDEHQVRFSKDIKPLTGVGFNEDFSMNTDPVGGKCVAGASLSDAMVIFKEYAIAVVPGEFPNDLGLNSTLGVPSFISSTIGCRDPKSVLALPEGIYFMSHQGLHLLDRSWNLTYVGGPVSDYESDTVLSTNMLRDTGEIRFLLDSGVTLCYDTRFGRWSTLTSRDAVDATIWRSNQYVYGTTSKILVEDSTTYLNDGSYVPMTIRTAWINLAGLQGFQRIYRMALLGTYYTNNAFYIKLRYDYSDIIRETEVVTASDLINTSVYGESSPYGSEDYYGGTEDEVYQLRKHLARQKCEALSIEITDGPAGATGSGRGYSIEGLALEVGGKGGIFRLSNSRSF